jgi:cholesterol oxidase
MNSSISSGKTVSLYSRICKLIKEYSEAVNGVKTSFAVETIAGIPSIF